MRIADRTEEVLEVLWEALERFPTGPSVDQLEEMGVSPDSLEDLVRGGLARLDKGLVQLTPWGHQHSRDVIRRHRLAERLFRDVVEANHKEMEEAACTMEHMLREGMEEKVCRLLGHPSRCPHGKPIPPGPCCKANAQEEESQVVPLSSLKSGQRGQIAYISTHESSRIQKLLAMGVLPGAMIHMVRTFPTFVFSVGYSEFAVDRETARLILVKRTAPSVSGDIKESR